MRYMHLGRKKDGKGQTFALHTHTQPISEEKMAQISSLALTANARAKGHLDGG